MKLNLNSAKFEQVEFDVTGQVLASDKRLQYLGLTFNGQRVLVRDSSLSRFHRRMAVAVRATALRAAESIHAGRTSKLYKRDLYERFGPRGRRNFLTGYVAKASKIMGDEAISRQVRRALTVLKRRIANAQRRFRLP
jgi:hypothetical protein